MRQTDMTESQEPETNQQNLNVISQTLHYLLLTSTGAGGWYEVRWGDKIDNRYPVTCDL